MATAAIKSQNLRHALDKLNLKELDAIVQQAMEVRASKFTPTLSSNESKLFAQINETLPEAIRHRKLALTRKRKNLTLTKAEHQELLRLTQAAERLDVKRLSALTKLARLRQLSVRALMKDLGIKPPPVHG
jgi:hypothetical protein